MKSSNDASDVDDESERSVNSFEAPEANHQNRFKGPRSTWRKLTEDERLVFTSMTQMRDQDLSVHLYNAHAMKRRHYDEEPGSKLGPWASKDRWRRSKPGEDDENSTNFVPPRSWTAWPLSSDIVPRSGELVGAGDGADEWTLKRREPQRPSRELEDILMAVTLKVSRDRFEKREWESSKEQDEEKKEKNGVDKHSKADAVDKIDGEEAAEQMSRDVLPIPPEDMSEEADRPRGAWVGHDGVDGDALPETEQELNGFSLINEAPETHSEGVPILQRPIISADVERSRRLLRPTVRHTLSRLDELLMALHNARQTCLYYASEHTESQSEFEGAEAAEDDSDNNDPYHLPSLIAPVEPLLEQPAKRLRPGRPPKVLQIPPPSANTLESIEPYKKETRGRKRKLHIRLDGESHEEMLIRIARQQKKAIPYTAPQIGSASSSPTKSARGSPQKRGISAHTREKRSKRLGLRDWSEILGTAALVGFSPEVIDRATQRCANLFGEGMTMLSLVENPTSRDEDQILDYLPSEIPDFDKLDNQSTSDSESDEAPATGRRASRGGKRDRLRSENEMDISKSGPETRSSGVDTPYYCSFTRRRRGFSKKHYLKKHLRDVHKLDQKELREAQEDSEEEMEGGVHINGFMKEVKRRTGWRALDGRPRRGKKRGRRVKNEGSEEEVPKGEEISERSGDGLDEGDGNLDKAFESD